MARDFESFIVDPDLLDPSIDATNLRTTTDTRQELLSDVPEFSGIEFDPTQKNYISDLYALYSGQLPSAPAPAVTTPVATTPSPTAGGGSGGGGQTTATTTAPITAPATTPTSGGITNVNTPLTQMITNPVTGQTQTVKQAMTSNQAYTTPTPSSPFLASGAAGGANLPSTSSQAPYGTNPTTGQPYQTPRTIADQNAVLGQTFNDQQDPSFWENAKNNFIQTGEDIGGFFANLGNQGIDLGQLAGTTILNLAGKALTGVPLLGTAASLVGAALPPRDPRQTALEELYDVENGTIQSGLMQGYNPVSGNPLNPTFGLQDAYDDRIDTIENTLKDKYNMTAAEIADVKAGSYTGDVDTNLLDTLNQLEEAKQTEKARLDLFSGDVDERDQMLEDISSQNQAQTEGDAIRLAQLTGDTTFDTTPTTTSTGVNPFEDIDTGVGEFDTAPVTGVTQPGTGTVLGLPGIDSFDDAETSIDMFQDATTPDLELENQYEDEDRFTGGTTVLGQPPIEKLDPAEAAMSNTGTAIDAFNQANRQQHFDNTQKLKDAVAEGKISNETYNKLSAFDATKTMGLDPVTGALSSIAYQGVQTAAGDQGVGDFLGDTARNIQGVSGNLTPEEQVQYQEIISGEDIYRDPILGMVEPPAPMTLADDTINRMTDDVDLDLFDTTPQDMPPMVSTTIGPDFGTTDGVLDSTFDAEEEDEIYEPPAPTPTPSPPTGTSRPGGDSRDDSPAPSPSPTTSQGVTTSQFQAFRDTGGGGGQDSSSTPSPSAPSSSSPSTGRGRTDAQSQYGGSSYSGGGGGGGNGGGGGGCFLADTLITMADGSTKEVQKVDLGDNVAEGGKVFATGKFLVENLHEYKGIKVSGSHMVNEDDNWVRVEDSKHGKSLGDDEHTVYVFGSENRRILINGILFTDYFETTEQEKLINDEKDFFNNWKTYENKIDQDNINILNAS